MGPPGHGAATFQLSPVSLLPAALAAQLPSVCLALASSFSTAPQTHVEDGAHCALSRCQDARTE